jgi:hypothetical protein
MAAAASGQAAGDLAKYRPNGVAAGRGEHLRPHRLKRCDTPGLFSLSNAAVVLHRHAIRD